MTTTTLQSTNAITAMAQHYNDLGFNLCAVNGKRPIGRNWQHNPIQPKRIANGHGIGLIHHLSGTVTLDIDSHHAYAVFEKLGLDLAAIITAAPYAIIGNPEKGPPKPIYLNPNPNIGRVALQWPHPDEPDNPRKKYTVFEFRGGTGHYQDVLPPSIHPDTGQPYQWRNNDIPNHRQNIPNIPPELLEIWQNWSELKPLMEAQCPWTKPRPTAPALPSPPPPNKQHNGFDETVEAEFNQRYTPGEILERNKYKPAGRNKWLAPGSSSGNPGVNLLDGKIYSHHGSDILGDGKPHNAYDVYRILEHDGNYRAAWITARKLLGLDQKTSNQNGHKNGLDPSQTAEVYESDEALQKILTPTYKAVDGQMLYVTYKTSDGQITANKRVVAPFVARIVSKTTIFDDYEQNVIYKISGEKGGRKFTAEITADQWADPRQLTSALLRYLPGKPPATDPRLRSHWGAAIAAMTDEEIMDEIKAINSTGWSPDGKAFVMPGGSVGGGYVCQMEPNIQTELGHFGLQPQTQAKQAQVVDALEELASVYGDSVVYPLIAHAFLPPLIHFVGNELRYMLHIHAQTGSLKTELAKIIMSLYGPQGSLGITYKWNGTPYGAESRANALKDCLMCIDDLKPGTINDNDQAKWVAFVQAAVDAQGRKRATIGGRAAASLPPRALLLSTGEAIPEAGEASYTARMLLAQALNQPSERNQLLDDIKKATPLFSGLMYAFIDWLIATNGQYIRETYAQLQEKTVINTAHARLTANYTANRLGALTYCRFCLDTGLMDYERAKNFLHYHQQGLLRVVNHTTKQAQTERYSQRFKNALDDALGTGFCVLSDTILSNAKRVGWEDDGYVYLLSGAKEVVDQWLRNSGQSPIHIAKKELAKQLYDDGLTHSTASRIEAGYYDYQAIDPATGKRPLVIAIDKTKLEAHETHETHAD